MDEINAWLKKFFGLVRLTHEREDYAEIQASIEKSIVFRGTNLWILLFANFIASVGLNMNSTAVIIGAMLISPLMGPINGVGYSVATYDFDLLKRSLKNFGFSVAGGLLASTIYFLITPIHTEHSELLARTSPTFYDVFIALFGGLAGIVAISSKNKGNVIPGVAIATALMPPLCTAGYGIAIGNWHYFAGAMYLFLINSVFIALAAMLVSQLLKVPKKEFILTREIKNTKIVVWIVILATVLPSLYLGYTLIQKDKFQNTADHFVAEVSVWQGNYLLRHDINPDEKTIHLVYAGNELDSAAERSLHIRAKDLGLGDAKLTIEQGITVQNFEDHNATTSQVDLLSTEVNRLKGALFLKEKYIDSLRQVPSKGEQLLREIQSMYPQINSCSFASSKQYVDSIDQAQEVLLVYFDSSSEVDKDGRRKIENWLKNRLNTQRSILKF